jgi:CHAT domain-containing protein
MYEADARYDEAEQLTRRALFLAQEEDSPEALYRWQWQMGRLYRAAGEDDRALAAYRASVRSLGELSGLVAAGSADIQASFRRQVTPVYEGLVDVLLSKVTGTGEGEGDQALLREARNVLEDLKAAELRDYFHDECLDARRRASPDEIPGALVIYPIILPDRLELIVGGSGRLSRHVTPVDAQTFTREVRAFRNALVKRTTYQYLAPARQLYDWLIRPLQPRLASGEVDTLVWVPGGVLRTIPFAALRDRETKTFLVEQYPLAITPGLTLTEPRGIDRESVKLLAAGISEAVMGYPALEHVPRELDALAQVFPGEQLRNADFSVDNFAERMAAAPHGIVHIASHGEFAADISESYILAYGEKLSMDRLATLVSATRFRDQPLELLTLSACKTAAGDERSALGLAGVALQAGARSALATLWSVDDAAAADLVSEFYVQLAKPELSRAAALQQAQLATMKRFRYRHAAYWAPFLLISSWL